MNGISLGADFIVKIGFFTVKTPLSP